MFIYILIAVYAFLVVVMLVIYTTSQRENLVKWGERKGLKNNFFIRALKKKPKKRPDKSGLSKVFTNNREH